MTLLTFIAGVLGLLAALSLLSAALAAWQLAVGLRFPLHQRLAPTRPSSPIAAAHAIETNSSPDPAPGITLLKPLKGRDGATEACLRSWFQQDYRGPVQLLLGVADLSDPVVPLVEQLIREHPSATATLVHCAPPLGINAKVSTLLHLQGHARPGHTLLGVSDADVVAPPDYLTQSVALLQDPRIGLVNSFYALQDTSSPAARWEALSINADFWSQVLQAASLGPINFALGAAMVFRRDAFERAGGYAPIADHLADDYELGHRLAAQGFTIRLSPIVVECRNDTTSFAAVWRHQLRWARTIRACRAGPYFASILSNATLWPLAWWLATAAATPGAPAAPFLALPAVTASALACVAFRSAQALLLERRLTQRTRSSALWMIWIKDLLQAALWSAAFLGRTVEWRGTRFRVDHCGKLTQFE